MTRILLNMPSQHAGKPSGVARVAFNLIEHLLRNDEFDYVLRSPWTRQLLPAELAASRLAVMTIERPPYMVVDVLKQAFVMPSLCRAENIDLMVNLDAFGAPAGARARVMIVHDLYFRTISGQFSKRERLTTGLIYRLMTAWHDQIVTVSDSTLRDLIAAYPSAARRTSTIHSAMTMKVVAGQHASPEVPGRYVLAVGNATANKNFQVMAEAVASLHAEFPDLAIVHVGHDDNETIMSVLTARAPAVRLVRLRNVDDARLAGLYHHAVCLCVPSLSEGFCLPVLEAQSLDCPVVCSNTSATPEIAGAGALTFDPASAAELAAHIAGLLRSADLRADLIRRGRDNLSRFSWEKAARQYEDVFRRALAKSSRVKLDTVMSQ